ncbi:RNA 2',3'-cyclic phosphodiesterase [Sporosarcina sp. NPDC096371]|uniref:RNA 2',3'-cyclic phosphodiesterase n=1 Tax=Sporosarcina sp. NPDC096371 TaxID=3364530 RepID=UPI0037F6C1E2
MQQHYFIGIRIPSTFEEQVESFKKKYQLETAYKVIPHIEDLHVTLLYLGTIPENLLPVLKKELVEIAARHPAFSIYVDGLSYFGTSSGPRVVYLSVKESIALAELQKEIDQTIGNQLRRPMSERFVPHVTIAKKRKSTDALVIQKESIQPIEVAVQSFSFFAVHPDKTPKYEVIETFELD